MVSVKLETNSPHRKGLRPLTPLPRTGSYGPLANGMREVATAANNVLTSLPASEDEPDEAVAGVVLAVDEEVAAKDEVFA